MSDCVILSVDVDHCCIEAAFRVKGSWVINRIHDPLDPQGFPLNLKDKGQVDGYVSQYAIDNYEAPTKVDPGYIRAFLEDQFVRGELERVAAEEEYHSEAIGLIKSDIIQLTRTLAKVQEEVKASQQAISYLHEAWWKRAWDWTKKLGVGIKSKVVRKK